ncbi:MULTISPECIES: sodium-dependent transporter [unclassified Planococcus (in: firmicutes)]|uniref:sodium-dependent transporter n=1 Tax=Planococcus TaxID=1372 RepID=UPI000C7973B9|nr:MULTISPECIES: sodium-dependent transporter [unclassified Planococcus (in: firmicutes)]PKG46044.1 sodium-dependent transporter [Planococcus sp. Urea-trap-24]PKG89967.1 sodium-dependent transporter [Planococcus sp. Urea-3u-39]PKH40588.1 sodium-dependent transporter [Planococcus sp. MB-3u-09]
MKAREQWTSKIGFILAAAGSAIGLGAIWKFPYETGANGGSVFILLFILSTVLIGLPILLAEFVIGRRGQADAVSGLKKQAPGKPWYLIGWSGFIFSFLILSFYSVVGGWVLSYLVRAVTLQLSGLGDADFAELFGGIISNPLEVLIAQAAFMALTIWIVQGGIKAGIERASKIMMPALLIFFVILMIRSLTLDGAMEGVRFMFVPDWSFFNFETALVALGQAFFSLSVGVAGMITYASYLKKSENLTRSAVSVVSLNIVISIMAGLIIFPAVFALDYLPDQGPGLVFIILPAIFDQLFMGQFLIIIFFILLLFATLTSSISMLEITVSIAVKNKYDRRRRLAFIIGLAIFVVGIPSALSFGVMSEPVFFGYTFFDFVDILTSRIGLPLGALFISLFAGYVLSNKDAHDELTQQKTWVEVWRVLVRYVAPAAIVIVFINGIIDIFS